MNRIKVLIADNNIVYRRGLKSVLGDEQTLEIVGEASDGNEAVEKARALEPHVVTVDLWMPNCNGVEAIRRLEAERPEAKVLVLTVSDRKEDLFYAIKVGALGYLRKDDDLEHLVRAIHSVGRGEPFISYSMAARMCDGLKTQQYEATGANNTPLTQREKEVVRLVAHGAQNKAIASDLSIATNTVKVHLRRILDKLHLANRSQVVAYALRTGLA